MLDQTTRAQCDKTCAGTWRTQTEEEPSLDQSGREAGT